MRFDRVFLLFLLFVAAMGFAGCASVSVEHSREAAHRLRSPAVIYVSPFVLSAAAREGLPENLRAKTVRQLAEGSVRAINHYAGKAVLLPGGYRAKLSRYWVVEGRIERVELGKRELRGTIGFGLGATKFETSVQVFEVRDGVRQSIMEFRTTGGSNSAPGGVFTLLTGTFVAAAVNAGTGMLPGLSADVERTSYEIAAQLSEFRFQKGILPRRYKHIRAKQEGTLSPQVNVDRVLPGVVYVGG